MGLCSQCAKLRREWLEAVTETFQAIQVSGENDLTAAHQKEEEAFRRYKKANRDCVRCKSYDAG
jgi:hypothetical protein